ncbi:MAG: hypothetical protein HY692_00805, partial [Cyanobacteria bacterium NC_groundwater_1444_Ag_S-0.65um_54_12]|nr:hypothetical protein [Cyanobacteria bacterium NC_groundwater_1444_Ag_S-0.65um_54_12]
MGSNVELQTVLASAAAPEPGKIQKAKPEATPLPSLQSDGLSLSGSFYTGSSAGFLVNWTARDLSSAPERNSSRPTFSLRSVSEADYAAPVEGYSPGEDEETSVEETSVVARLCSVIGHTLSFQTESVGYTERAAHPWANSTLQTIDMRTGKPIELTDLFPQEVLYKALLRDKVVKRA